MDTIYDAIVVGARCAGAPTAMLLARQGHRVLLVDRATFPSDTLSTHVIHAPGVAALSRWDLLDQVVATGCPPIQTYAYDFGPFAIRGVARPVDGQCSGYAPRRTVLDKILVDAATASGVEVREGFNVDSLLIEGGTVAGISGHTEDGEPVEAKAQIVVGADGKNSHVAKAVQAAEYEKRPRLQYSYYSYFRDLPTDGMEVYIRPDRGFAAAPTNDGMTMVVAGWPYAEAASYKADVEANYLKTFELAPEFAERVRAATRMAPFLGGAVRGFFRTPFGPGWALVGDAGYNKDPITAQGISDAFRDAQQCSMAIDAWLNGGSTYEAAMTSWHRARDNDARPSYEFTSQLATLEPPPPEMQQLLGSVHGNQEAMDGFVSVVAGTVSPVEFFSPDNIGRIMQAAVQPAVVG
jgi:2-polyprenyl-6-methoxyphenol hydroxylase-like FAD-dependent oxidoreductase